MIFWAYIRARVKSIACMAVILIIFGVVYFLADIPLDIYLYGLQLSAAFLLIAAGVDYYHFLKKHQSLAEFFELPHPELRQLPAAADILEQDYQDILERMMRINKELVTRSDQTYTDSREYYMMWAHQIKTPLSALKLLLQLEGNLSERGELEQEVFKIEQYVELALQYVRLDHMENDLEFKEYDLKKLVRQTVKKYSVIFINKKLSIDMDGVSGKVLTDEKWLSLILEQLLSNALKYTNQGGIRFYMEPGQEKTLVIQDTGIGIREEDVHRIFERGFTGYNGRMDKKSTGIGLYLCKKAADQLGHKIHIESKVGEGTRVMLDLRSDKLEIF